MLLKAADNKNNDIQILESLQVHPKASADTKKLIEREIRNIRAGMKGEAESAYELDFNFKSRNWMVIHDLRIEHDGRVAQIDHLLINRWLSVYVCESKRFGEGVAINDQGEFSAFFRHRPYGIPSPLEQNNRHILVLKSLLQADVVQVPRRLGFKISPDLEGYVLVSKAARISRPKTAIPGLDKVVKTDQFVSQLSRAIDQSGPLAMARVISQDTLEAFGRQLAALHKPIQFDWAAKFGLAQAEGPTPDSAPEAAQPAPVATEPVPAQSKSKLVCSACDAPVSYAVAKFCWNARRFGGKVFCMACQKKE
jgi:hypothetical protein